MESNTISIGTSISAPIEMVWGFWTLPEHITQWNFATDEWICPTAKNELEPQGQLNWRMEAKDGSIGFDFIGTYQEIIENQFLSYKMSDGRMVTIKFEVIDEDVKLTESFEAEGTNSDEQQRVGWQAILNNFKKYAESNKNEKHEKN